MTDASKPNGCCPVVELRQYTLQPGARETLVRLFDEHFVEGQEDYGMRVLGQFRDLGNPHRFVWVRAFDDMESRTRAIEGFYSGPVWTKHREEANATMIDFANVLLLRPAGEDTAFRFDPRARPGRGDPDRPGGVVVTTVHYLVDPAGASTFGSWFRTEMAPALAAAGTSVLAQFVTEPAANPVPWLPVREGETVFVWFAAYPDRQAEAAAAGKLEAQPRWDAQIVPALRAMTKGDPERLVLAPTRRSWLRGVPA